MRLFFDARYIKTDFHDGMSRYSAKLGSALAAITPTTFIICDERQLDALPPESASVRLHSPVSLLEPFSALFINKHHPDVVISPQQTIGSLGRRYRLILTQQDMTYYRLPTPPADLPWYVRVLWRLYHRAYWPGRLLLNRAEVVATVSQASKREIENASLTKRSIIVVPNAAEDLSTYLDKPITQGDTPPKNLVFMGAFYPHKNVETLVVMMRYLPSRTLHLLSKVSAKRRVELLRLAHTASQIVFHDGVSDKDYVRILADDAIMVSASKSEGFGLPLAEALKLGVPAVVSDIAVFHEVAGDGALYAPATDAQAFAHAVTQLDAQSARTTLATKGQSHIASFDWNRSAMTIYQAATQLIGETVK